jgi:hypothetical protein
VLLSWRKLKGVLRGCKKQILLRNLHTAVKQKGLLVEGVLAPLMECSTAHYLLVYVSVSTNREPDAKMDSQSHVKFVLSVTLTVHPLNSSNSKNECEVKLVEQKMSLQASLIMDRLSALLLPTGKCRYFLARHML